MRAPGHSSRMCGAGARGPWLSLWVGALLVLGVAAGAARLAETGRAPGGTAEGVVAVQDGRAEAPGAHGLRGVTGASARQRPCLRFHGVGFDTWAAFDGGPSLVPAHASCGTVRGRGSCPSPFFTVPRWSRARVEPSDTAMARRVRYPVAPVSSRGGLADQPPLVTRPLRGPPRPV